MTDTLRNLLADTIAKKAWPTAKAVQYVDYADAIIAALKANGLVVVPDQITREMGDMLCYDYDLPDLQRDWIACLAASPYAKEFE